MLKWYIHSHKLVLATKYDSLWQTEEVDVLQLATDVIM